MKNYRLTKYTAGPTVPPVNTDVQMNCNRDAIRFGNDLLYDMQEASEGFYDEKPDGRLVYSIRDRRHRLLAKIESV